MMRVVIDTNVIVSGFLSPYGAPAEVLRMLIRGDLELCVDPRIIAEYEEVLKRPKFGFDTRQIEFFIDYIEHTAQFIMAEHIDISLKDTGDIPFVQVAISGNAFAIVTGNAKDYPAKKIGRLKILNPVKFLTSIKKKLI